MLRDSSGGSGNRISLGVALRLLAVLGGAGCGGRAAATGEPGAPLPGLGAAELARFRAGAELFNHVFSPAEGLGPAFNENQCSACHTSPASGGVGGERVLKATRFDRATGCNQLTEAGGENIRRQLTPQARALGLKGESPPPAATTGRFTAPALYGLGFVDAVPDAALLELQERERAHHDGVAGRVGRTADGRVGRFGRKADVATLAEFASTALRFEMGLTTSRYPREAVQGRPVPAQADPAPDPEVADSAVARLTDFVRFLAPPGRGPPRAGLTAAVAQGERWFAAIGCAGCHVPGLRTGPSPVSALDQRRVNLYSDLLLHDMGPALADVCAPGARPSEVRTAPLMGLRFRELLLHDGRVTSLREAIMRHGGEASAARDRFAALSPAHQIELIAFLETL